MKIEDINHLIKAIHAAPQMIVFEFAGAGIRALAWLHGVAGSSQTVLEAVDRYAPSALTEAVGFVPEQFVSVEVSSALARTAYRRACHLAPLDAPVVGLGCTAAIATDRQKRGDHRCFVSALEDKGLKNYALTLTKGARSREEEEHLVSRLVLTALASVCHLRERPELSLQAGEEVIVSSQEVDLVKQLLAERVDSVLVWPDGLMKPDGPLSGLALFSGSFNPLHSGHQLLAEVGAKQLGQAVFFELPLVNAGKGRIEPAEARQRLAQFAGRTPVILTRAPLFSQKARLFPSSVFIIGADTAERLLQPRFYNNDPAHMATAFSEIEAAGCHFMVAGRLSDNQFLTLKDISIPAKWQSLFEEIPVSDFRLDISSTTLRQEADP